MLARTALRILALAATLAAPAAAQVPIVAGDITPRTQIDSVAVDPEMPASTPLTLVGYQPLVDVVIDGKPAGKFLVATGWARTTIISSTAESLGLVSYNFAEVRDTPNHGRYLINARKLSFGPVDVALQGLWTEPGVRNTTHGGVPIAGIIGWDVLRSLSFTLSASSKTFQVYPGGIPADVAGTRLKLADSWDQFPVVQVPGITSGADLPLLLDTAIDVPVFLSQKAFRASSGAPSSKVALQSPNVATGKALALSTVFRTGSDAWSPVAPNGSLVYVAERPAPLFRFGAVGLIGNGVLARSDLSIDHRQHVCIFGEPSAAPVPLPGLDAAKPADARQLAIAYLDAPAAARALQQIEEPTFEDLGPSVAWIEDRAFASAVELVRELTEPQFADLVDRCSGVDDTLALEALLAWAKAHSVKPNPSLIATISGAALSGSNGVLEIVNRELKSLRFVAGDGFTALHYACSGGHVDTIRFCLDAKISPNVPGPAGLQPLELLGNAGTPEAFDLMIARGASVRKPYAGINLAVTAADSENSPIVKKAVEAGFDPNWTSDDRVTPLMSAAYNGDTDLVQFLVKNGAEPATTDNNGENALYYCVRGSGSAETFKALLDAGVPHDTTSFEHGTLVECISTFASPELLALALAASGDKPASSPFGSAPVATAARRGHFELIKALVAAGYDPTREDTDGLCPLEWCAVGNHPGIAAYLLSQKGERRPDARDIARSVHLAARWGNGEVFLILAGAASDEVREKIDADRLLEDAVLGNHTRVLSLVVAKRLTTLPADTSLLVGKAKSMGAIYTAAALTE